MAREIVSWQAAPLLPQRDIHCVAFLHTGNEDWVAVSTRAGWLRQKRLDQSLSSARLSENRLDGWMVMAGQSPFSVAAILRNTKEVVSHCGGVA